MHADYLSVTMSEENCHAVVDELTPILAHLGIASAYEGLYKLHTGGTLKTGRSRGPAHHVSASGDFLNALRGYNLWAEYLMILGARPCRVTRLDIAQDYQCDAPVELRKFRKKVEAGKVSLTRRKLDLQTQYNAIMSLNRYGEESGTVYIGPRSVQVAGLKVYDKAKQQYDKFGRDMPPTLRWELKLGRKAGLSLRDAYEPDPVFWHYMSDLLPAPDGVPAWVPNDDKLSLPTRTKLLPAESLKRLVESSDSFARAFTLADMIGAHGMDYFVRLLTELYARKPINESVPKTSPSRTVA